MAAMNDLQTRLADCFAGRIHQLQIKRGNEIHLHIAREDALPLAALLQDEFQARLVLMLANDRRASLGIFEVHSLFANDAENWFVHATQDLPAGDPSLDSMATFYLPAGRYEREIDDMFGVKILGHPVQRRLVR